MCDSSSNVFLKAFCIIKNRGVRRWVFVGMETTRYEEHSHDCKRLGCRPPPSRDHAGKCRGCNITMAIDHCLETTSFAAGSNTSNFGEVIKKSNYQGSDPVDLPSESGAQTFA
ncbi:unnamed protein product [Phytophthora lilii]|uniref:Unnamed protein product n=1 Tax=Phytophthora lilii TaxID=2077276 RepID=A0A9W6YGJ1_9STRA|nr:unnamed protein product [Phytophthora lilii]